MQINHTLIKPILTEKATSKSAQKVYMFEVAKNANKNQVKAVLENLYKIKVGKVAISVRKGKIKRTGRRMMPKKRADRRIAYITVKEGKIDLFPQA